jgi:hypothetical protein
MKAIKQNKKDKNKIDIVEVSNKSLLTKYARKSDKADADQEDGEPIKKKKSNKKYGAVALKHNMVLNNIKKNVGKSGKLNIKKAMEDTGYSPNYSKSGNILKTKSWQDKMEYFLDDSLLLETHNDLVVAKKLDYMLFNPDIKDEDIYELIESVGCVPKKIIHGIAGTHAYYFAPDNVSRNKALELAYKIRGKMSPEVLEIRKGLSAMTDEELAEIIKKQTRKFTKQD